MHGWVTRCLSAEISSIVNTASLPIVMGGNGKGWIGENYADGEMGPVVYWEWSVTKDTPGERWRFCRDQLFTSETPICTPHGCCAIIFWAKVWSFACLSATQPVPAWLRACLSFCLSTSLSGFLSVSPPVFLLVCRSVRLYVQPWCNP